MPLKNPLVAVTTPTLIPIPDTLPCVSASCKVELLSNAVLAIPTQLSPS